jgi:DNA-binding beta-propeller fold protein YncE
VQIGTYGYDVELVASGPILNSPFGVAVDSTNEILYFTSYTGNSIFKLSLSGTFPVLVTNADIVFGSSSGEFSYLHY